MMGLLKAAFFYFNLKCSYRGFVLFFLGHMVWAYAWAAIFAGKRNRKLFIPMVLMLGIMPDIDLFLRGFSVFHHTFTHSFFFWLILFVPFLIIYRRKSVPYFVAVAQHFAFGDFLVGNVMILWPFSQSYFGFNIAMLSMLDVALETVGLLLAAGISYFNSDLKRMLSIDIHNVLMFLPLLALLASMLIFAVDWSIIPLVAYIWSRKLLTTIVLGHIFLVTLLALSTLQGLRRLLNNRERTSLEPNLS